MVLPLWLTPPLQCEPGRLAFPSNVIHGAGPASDRVLVFSGKVTSRGSLFFTALGDDELGHRALSTLEAMSVRVESSIRPCPGPNNASRWHPS
jgi:sugar/nucleoside kinase (ribokinase family)